MVALNEGRNAAGAWLHGLAGARLRPGDFVDVFEKSFDLEEFGCAKESLEFMLRNEDFAGVDKSEVYKKMFVW